MYNLRDMRQTKKNDHGRETGDYSLLPVTSWSGIIKSCRFKRWSRCYRNDSLCRTEQLNLSSGQETHPHSAPAIKGNLYFFPLFIHSNLVFLQTEQQIWQKQLYASMTLANIALNHRRDIWTHALRSVLGNMLHIFTAACAFFLLIQCHREPLRWASPATNKHPVKVNYNCNKCGTTLSSHGTRSHSQEGIGAK